MRRTQEADYALRILFYLAKRGERTDAATLSELSNVPQRFALKILRKLVGAHLVGSYKGVSGGYILSKPPSDITLKDVIEAIDGPIMINRCIDDDYECSRMGKNKELCFAHCTFCSINAEIAKRLSEVTLESLADDSSE